MKTLILAVIRCSAPRLRLPLRYFSREGVVKQHDFLTYRRCQLEKPVRIAGSGLLIVAASFLLCTGCPPHKPPAPQTAQVAPFIRGYVATPVGGREKLAALVAASRTRDIYLPNVRVFLLNLADNRRTAPIRTDLSGRFTVFAKQGRYRVCWEAKGFVSDCSKDIYSLSNAPINVGAIRIPIDRAPKTTAVSGTVRLADGSQPRFLEPMANGNAFGQVELIDHRGNVISTAYVNNFGEYLLPQVPV